MNIDQNNLSYDTNNEVNNSDKDIPDIDCNLLLDAAKPDFIHIIEYLEEKERKNKLHNNIAFICTILAAIFAAISVILALLPYII